MDMLVVNAGSSSIKVVLFGADLVRRGAASVAEIGGASQIGGVSCVAPDHQSALALCLAEMGVSPDRLAATPNRSPVMVTTVVVDVRQDAGSTDATRGGSSSVAASYSALDAPPTVRTQRVPTDAVVTHSSRWWGCPRTKRVETITETRK